VGFQGGHNLPFRFHRDRRNFNIPAIAATAVLAAAALIWWLTAPAGLPLKASLPGEDGAPPGREGGAVRITDTAIPTSFTKLAGIAAVLPGEWPGFRGPDRDNFAKDAPELADLSAGPPPVIWEVGLGEGHAGAAVSEGRVYILDYIEADKTDALRCFALSDGTELWRRAYPVKLKRNHGFSRTVPAVSGSFVLTLGPSGTAMCVDKISGELLWIFSLVDRYGARIPPWYTGQCPLADGGQAVFAPGGDALMAGVDLASGSEVWRTPNPDGWQMSHSSVMKYELDGVPVFLYAAIGGVAAVSAAEEDRGRTVWTAAWSVQVIAPSPLAMPGSEVLLTAGYGAGSMGLRVERGKPRVLFIRGPDRGMASEQQTPILFRDLLFGILPKDAGELHDQLVCMTPNGSVVWSSGKTDRYGLGPYILADGKIFILSDDGKLSAVRAGTETYELLGSAALMEGTGVDAWGPMALAGTRLIVRDSTRLFCVELAAAKGGDG
jgi:outer membrane protein assembly factor BamB